MLNLVVSQLLVTEFLSLLALTLRLLSWGCLLGCCVCCQGRTFWRSVVDVCFRRCWLSWGLLIHVLMLVDSKGVQIWQLGPIIMRLLNIPGLVLATTAEMELIIITSSTIRRLLHNIPVVIWRRLSWEVIISILKVLLLPILLRRLKYNLRQRRLTFQHMSMLVRLLKQTFALVNRILLL